MYRGRVKVGPLMREARLSQDCDPNSNELSTWWSRRYVPNRRSSRGLSGSEKAAVRLKKPLVGSGARGKDQNARRPFWSKVLVDRATETRGERVNDFESASRTDICFTGAVVSDAAFDE
jgi:hypothetical protein